MTVRIIVTLVLLCVSSLAAQDKKAAENLEKRKAYLRQLLELIPPEHPDRGWVTRLDHTWRDWLERTGELPPDFDQLPSLPFLPDPLVLDKGGRNEPVTAVEQWRRKREWIAEQVKHWITGTFPPPPGNVTAQVISQEKYDGAVSRTVRLSFGPEGKAGLTLELLIPPGEGPFPVFLTQWNHRGWALVALRRGYLGCVYAGADSKDDTESYADIWYPQYDFTRLMRRAWAAHRAVDYLYTLPEVDRQRIGLTGHSRNGKQSLMAAAFDERITAVISSSGGTGAEDPYRYTSEKFDNESISQITTGFPYWLHPRLRFFIGREHKLPVDENLLMALVAPRGLMLSSAITEDQGNPWGIEQNYRSLERVYRFLEADDKLAIRLRHGLHGTSARDIEAYCDFFDYVFGRNTIRPPCDLYYNYTFERWLSLSQERVNLDRFPVRSLDDLLADSAGRGIKTKAGWQGKKDDIRRRLAGVLGEEPAGAKDPGPGSLPETFSEDYLGGVIGRPAADSRMGRTVIGPYSSFGDYLYGNLYYPLDEQGNRPARALPAVVFLHEYAYPTGFARGIGPLLHRLTADGFAVFAFDMVGFGTRIEEGTLFYERYPHWSKMDRMAADVSAAVDALQGLDLIDPQKIYAAGYSLGGTVGLAAAALDERITGVVSVCGFTPLRGAGPESGTEGLAAYSHLHGLLPRLGFFIGHETKV
ncbi:MAG: alpha/beta fold hydrolase, partial [Candidatus Glassbacteria bacterium]